MRAHVATKIRTARVFATWFGCGYSPVAPGTAGSLAAVALALPLHYFGGFGRVQFLALSLLLLYPAVKAADTVASESGRKDPQFVVVDEVLGQWLTLAGARSFGPATFVLSFVLFRLFDILKPPPIRLIEEVPGGAGIVLDDMMAGAYAALVLFAVGWFNHL